MNDGLIEIAGITSSFHMGTITVSLTNAIRVAQANHVTLRIKPTATNHALPFQVDGEPACLAPQDTQIDIVPHESARMLSALDFSPDMTKPHPVRFHQLTDDEDPELHPDFSTIQFFQGENATDPNHDRDIFNATPVEGEFLFC